MGSDQRQFPLGGINLTRRQKKNSLCAHYIEELINVEKIKVNSCVLSNEMSYYKKNGSEYEFYFTRGIVAMLTIQTKNDTENPVNKFYLGTENMKTEKTCDEILWKYNYDSNQWIYILPLIRTLDQTSVMQIMKYKHCPNVWLNGEFYTIITFNTNYETEIKCYTSYNFIFKN